MSSPTTFKPLMAFVMDRIVAVHKRLEDDSAPAQTIALAFQSGIEEICDRTTDIFEKAHASVDTVGSLLDEARQEDSLTAERDEHVSTMTQSYLQSMANVSHRVNNGVLYRTVAAGRGKSVPLLERIRQLLDG